MATNFNYQLTGYGRFLEQEGIHIQNVGYMTIPELLHQIGYTLGKPSKHHFEQEIFRENGESTNFYLILDKHWRYRIVGEGLNNVY